jgi:hypothetical protein
MTAHDNTGKSMPTATAELTLAETAYESIRAINHLTISTHPIPAPELYGILGNLKSLAWCLDQALHQLGNGLRMSLTTHQVYESDGADPAMRATWALGQMEGAALHALTIGALLDRAQTELAGQGYHIQQV